MSTTTIQVRLRIQLNSILFAKTLVRKDVASSAPPPSTNKDISKLTLDNGQTNRETADNKDEDEFSSKAQIMTLMTTDVDRVSDLAWHAFALVGTLVSRIRKLIGLERLGTDSPIEIAIGSIFLYKLLGKANPFSQAIS